MSDDESITSMKVGLRLRTGEAFRRRFLSKKNPQKTAADLFPKPVRLPRSEVNQNYSTPAPGEPSPHSSVRSLPKGLVIPPLPAVLPPADRPTDRLERGTRNECKTLDARYTRKGDYELKESTSPFDHVRKRGSHSIFDEYCMIITRKFDQENRLKSTILKIQSPYLIKALREIVKYYPDNPVDVGNTITVEEPPALIFHYRKELETYAQTESTADETKLHIDYVLTYLELQMGSDIKRYDDHIARGLIKFEWLWMIFRSGCIVYESETDQLYYFHSGTYKNIGRDIVMELKCTNINYDGTKVGKEEHSLSIGSFETARELTSLRLVPLELLTDIDGLKARLKERAKRFLGLRGIHAQHHSTYGRVMVDCKTSQTRSVAIKMNDKCSCSCKVCQKLVPETPQDYDHELRELTDDELLLCSSSVCGFSLAKKQWLPLRIDDLSEVRWSEHAIDSLVMDKVQKNVILSLVTSPMFLKGVSTDIFDEKGKGLVVLLHGTPGTGKTLTAECVCEHLKRPLYVVSGGELGSTPDVVESALKDILELSALWKAIILIDESDVFLEQRSASDILRNSLVSVFLRQLEYFEGMLFLTTNRVDNFDVAFTSRIHLALHYPELESDMRRQIWVNSIKRLPQHEVDIDVEKDLEVLAKEELNGRVISYAVRTAKALADTYKEKLKVSHLMDVVGIYQRFNKRTVM